METNVTQVRNLHIPTMPTKGVEGPCTEKERWKRLWEWVGALWRNGGEIEKNKYVDS